MREILLYLNQILIGLLNKMYPRKKSKNNPLKICYSCGSKIFNRDNNVMYCKTCYKTKVEITRQTHGKLNLLRREMRKKGYDFKITITLVKKRTQNQSY